MPSLWDSLSGSRGQIPGALLAPDRSVALSSLLAASALSVAPASLAGACVLVATRSQLSAALALIELDGIARRLVIATPDVSREHLRSVIDTAGADTIVVDEGRASEADLLPRCVRALAGTESPVGDRHGTLQSEWVLLTSGTTGAPKLVLHDLDSLGGALPRRASGEAPLVWSTFYDIRRYGGMQIFLRAILGGAPLVLSSPDEPVREFLARAGAAGVTHISGTPSHWRRALMSGAGSMIAPRYVRLSGEIADQAILDALRAAYPQAVVAHAFASTEAGVAFDVTDGRAGFPAAMVGAAGAGAALRVEDGTLRIKSARTASRYLGAAADALAGPDGFVDTGDMVELRDGRYYFVGRRGGVINVGGLKVHPEEVEAVINADPRVRMSLVRARRNPITGAVVVADVVLNGSADDPAALEALKRELVDACRGALAAHKVPTLLRIVPGLELTPAGKLVRPVG